MRILEKTLKFLIILFIINNLLIGKTIGAVEDNLSKGNLSDTKIELEIEKLKVDINNSGWLIKFQTGTAVCSTITVLISLFTMIHTIRSQNKKDSMQLKENRKNIISNYITQLSSADQAVKLSAIQALGNYEETIQYLINSLKYEEDYFIINALSKTIVDHASDSIDLLIDESKLILIEKIKIAAEMDAIGKKVGDIERVLDIDKEFYEKLKEDKWFIDTKNDVTYNIEIEKTVGKSEEEIINDRYKNILLKSKKINNFFKILIHITGLTMEKVFKENKVYDISEAYLPKIQLRGIDMSKWNLKKTNLQGAVFNNCIFIKSKFDDCILKNTSFRGSTLKGITFNNLKCNKCDFSLCNMENIYFENLNSYEMSFKGATLKKCSFLDGKYIDCKMQGVKFINVKLQNFKLYRCNFMNSKINSNTILDNVELKGSIFNESEIKKVKLNECDINSITFKNGSVKDSEFINMDLTKVGDFTIDKSGNTKKDCITDEDSSVVETSSFN